MVTSIPLRPLLLAASFTLTFGVTLSPLRAQLEHRKTNLDVRVENLSGTPLPGATVRVEMLNHAFRFGCSVEHFEITPGDSRYNPKLVENLQKYFNSTTFGNVLKWAPYESTGSAAAIGYLATAKALKPFNSDGTFQHRGHATIWGAEYAVPVDARAMTDPAALRDRLLNHVFNYHTALKNRGIDVYDLYNEPFHERTHIINKLAPNATTAQEGAEIATWFKKAREADPNAVLYINEYNILNFWQENDSDVIAYKRLVDAIRDAGGPVGGIGEQAHMDRMITKAQIKRRLDILAAAMPATTNYPNGLPGLPIEVTELDVNTSGWNPSPEVQATLVTNVLEAAFEHPSVVGITIWGMNNRGHWRGNAVMFDDSDPNNWVLKPSGRAWVDRVKGLWWTNETGLSGTNGTYTASVFKGTHKIVVEYLGQTQEFVRDLTSPTQLTVQFATEPVDTSHSQLVNLSVRSKLAANEEITIGFHVASGPTPVLVRAAGPALAFVFGNEAMPDPRFSLFANSQNIANNDNWDASIASTFTKLGAFPFETGSKDAASVESLNGSNTARVSGTVGGHVLVEAYDNSPSGALARLTNISARKHISGGSDILIAGFSVSGTGYKRLLIRGIGPRLADFMVAGALPDPKIQLYKFENNSSTLVAENNDWSGLSAVFEQTGAFPLNAGSKDAAMVVLVPAGAGYTAQVSSATSEAGIALIEVYDLP